MEKDEIVVYWGSQSDPRYQMHYTLLDLKPEPLAADLVRRRAKNVKASAGFNGGNYQACAAWHTVSKNMFILKAPFSCDVELDTSGKIIHSSIDGWFTPRLTSIENSFAIDFDVNYLLFSKDRLDFTFTPPYLHNPKAALHGFPVPARFDVSSWFRPLAFCYQLWPGVKQLVIEEGEPLGYLKFETERKVVLKQYLVTEEIKNISDACSQFKMIKQFEPLEKLYDRFTRTKLNKVLIEQIEKNLI